MQKASTKQNTEQTDFVDPIELWIEELDQMMLQARKDGTNENEPILFTEVLPRLKRLGKILLEEADQAEEGLTEIADPQFVQIRVSTVSLLRQYLLGLVADPEGFGAFCALEADLEGLHPEEIAQKIIDAQQKAAEYEAEHSEKINQELKKQQQEKKDFQGGQK